MQDRALQDFVGDIIMVPNQHRERSPGADILRELRSLSLVVLTSQQNLQAFVPLPLVSQGIEGVNSAHTGGREL
jgi:hypothetical protein